jgi:osmotically-inducible protein OsmY
VRFKFKTVVGVGAASAAGMWLFDPDRGAQRRHQLQDQLRSWLKKSKRTVERQVQQGQTKLENTVHKANHRGTNPPADDQVLVDRIKSELLGQEPFADHDILIEANEGVVVLRGQVDDRVVREQLETAVAEMVGVELLQSLLHSSGEDAPNKAAALRASD